MSTRIHNVLQESTENVIEVFPILVKNVDLEESDVMVARPSRAKFPRLETIL